MHSNRLLVLLGGCLLAASAAMADDLGSVDCASHPDATPVYAKARKSQDIVANVPCGEKFKVILFGFIFSEIQTSDGKVGFVFSNVVTVDRAGGTLQSRAASTATPPLTSASDTTKIPAEPKPYAAPAPPKRAPASAAEMAEKMGGSTSVQTKPAPAPAQDSVAPAPAVSASAPVTPAPAPAPTQPASAASIAPQPAPVQAAAPSTSLPDSSTVLKATSSPNADAAPTAAPVPQSPVTPADAAPAVPAPPAQASPDAAPASVNPPATDTSSPTPAGAPADAVSAPAAQPSPEAEPPVVESAKKHKTESWERPNASARSLPLIELYGGFAFARTAGGGGTYNNMLGGVGSFGWNFKPWLQIAGDSSYNTLTISGTKNVLYGNHYGARYFFRLRNPFHITPFAEGLVGGSRVDATAAGTTISQNCLSYKIGGGLDFRSPHIHLFELRLIDFDYYRTAFGTNLYQNNYWISTGVVLRLFGGRNAD